MSVDKSKNHDRYVVPGLVRGLDALLLISNSETPLNITNVADGLGLSKSSVFRILYTLEHLGFIEPRWGGRAYSLSPKTMQLGTSYLKKQNILDVAQPFLRDLRDATAVSSHLAVRDRLETVYLATYPSKNAFISNINTGDREPLHASPIGWATLAAWPEEGIGDIFAGYDFVKMTKHTPLSAQAVADIASQIARDGYFVSRGYYEPDGSTVSAPIYGPDHTAIAAISISAPDSGFDFAKLDTFYVAKVVATATAISERMGASPGASEHSN